MPDWVTGGLVPSRSQLPDVLPSDRLTASAMPVREIRGELRRIPTVRNTITVIGVWVSVAVTIGGAVWLDHPLGYVAAFFLMGRNFAAMAILGHEASHRLLFHGKRLNDWIGAWLSYYPMFTAYDIYRRSHAAHHRREFGDGEPDMNFYSGFPVGWASMRRKFGRDIFGVTGYRNLATMVQAFGSERGRPIATRIVVAQLALVAIFTAFGRPELYLLLYLAPWLTVWKVLNRLRAIAEHGGMHESDDRRETTHHVRQTLLPRFWVAPLNTGWHLAHHVDSGVPFRNLPKLHKELEAAGYVTPELVWPNYRSLWRAMANGRTS